MAKKHQKKKGSVTAAKGAEVCFVISPFGGWNDRYAQEIFYPAVRDAGLEPLRADDIYGPSPIVADIWQSVRKARVVLADLTGRNPNVLYELGLAHAIRRPVVMVTQTIPDVPFDLQALRVIVYDLHAPDWGGKLRTDIATSLKEVVSTPDRFVPATFLQESPKHTTGGVEPQEKRILQLEQQVASMRQMLNAQRTTILPISPYTVLGTGGVYSLGSDPNAYASSYIRGGAPWITPGIQHLGPQDHIEVRTLSTDASPNPKQTTAGGVAATEDEGAARKDKDKNDNE